MLNPLAYGDDDYDDTIDYEATDHVIPKDPNPMSEADRNAAIAAFFAKGNKVTHCPTKAAKQTIWMGGKPSIVEEMEKHGE